MWRSRNPIIPGKRTTGSKRQLSSFFRFRPWKPLRWSFEFHDKIPLKKGFAEKGVRVVPQALARYGSFIERGAILMPSYVNIGAWVGSGTVDTGDGESAQIGRNVHLAGGVGIGGVSEAPASNAHHHRRRLFYRFALYRGGRRAGGTRGGTRRQRRAHPEYAYYRRDRRRAGGVQGPRSRPVGGDTRYIPGGTRPAIDQVACALIIGQRQESTDKKYRSTQALREYQVAFRKRQKVNVKRPCKNLLKSTPRKTSRLRTSCQPSRAWARLVAGYCNRVGRLFCFLIAERAVGQLAFSGKWLGDASRVVSGDGLFFVQHSF